MTQRIEALRNGRWVQLLLPRPNTNVLVDVQWGLAEALFTPAYWASQAWFEQVDEQQQLFRIGSTLAEEVTACILGSHGMPAEVGLAAFRRLRDRGLISAASPLEELLEALTEPLQVSGRLVRYRFAHQKSQYLHIAFKRLMQSAESPTMLAPKALRQWLMGLPGVGPKTASWIVRNWHASDEVAILDIHVMRAGWLIGLFPKHLMLPRDYLAIESLFLHFARAIGVGAARLDALIWSHMRSAPRSILASVETANERRARPDQAALRITKQRREPSVACGSQEAERELAPGSYKTKLAL